VAEGMTLVFLGLLVLVTTLVIGPNAAAANLVFVSAAVMLFLAWLFGVHHRCEDFYLADESLPFC